MVLSCNSSSCAVQFSQGVSCASAGVLGWFTPNEEDLKFPIISAEVPYATVCRWPGQQVPLVRFVSGREAFMLPEVFETDVHTSGTCRRIQVRSQREQRSLCDPHPAMVASDMTRSCSVKLACQPS